MKLKYIISILFVVIFITMFSISAFAVSSITGGVTNDIMQIQLPSDNGYLDTDEGSITLYRDCNNLTFYVFPSYTSYGDEILGEPGTLSALSPVNLPAFVRFGSNFGEDEGGALSLGMQQTYEYSYNGTNVNRSGGGYKALRVSRVDTRLGFMSNLVEYVISPKKIDGAILTGLKYQCVGDVHYYITDVGTPIGLTFSSNSDFTTMYDIRFDGLIFFKNNNEVTGPIQYMSLIKTLSPGQSLTLIDLIEGSAAPGSEVLFSGSITITANGTVRENFVRFNTYYHDIYSVRMYEDPEDESYQGSSYRNVISHPIYRFFSYVPDGAEYPSRSVVDWLYPHGTLNVDTNGVYDASKYNYVNVSVHDDVPMFGWLSSTFGSFMSFEIAPGWSIGIILTIVISLSIAFWIIRLFLGG